METLEQRQLLSGVTPLGQQETWMAPALLAAAAPANDNFANAIDIAGMAGNLTTTNAGASKELGEPSVGYSDGRSIWWRWQAPASGVAIIDTFGSDFDTVLSAYTGTDLGSLTEVASNDDMMDLQSQVWFSADAGQTYYVRVAGFSSYEYGTVALNWVELIPPANDDLANAAVIGDADLLPGATALWQVGGSNVIAGSEVGEPVHDGNGAGQSVWWSWTAPADQITTINTFGSDFDTILAVYTGSSIAELQFVVSSDDVGDLSTSSVTFMATAGTTYQIAVDGYYYTDGATSGDITLFVGQAAAPANDNFADAAVIAGDTVSLTQMNHGASLEVGEPLHADDLGGQSVWYAWTAPTSGVVEVNTDGSNFATLLDVYSGDDFSNLTALGSSSASFNDVGTSRVVFTAAEGATYYISVDGYGGTAGLFNLNLGYGQTVTLADVNLDGAVRSNLGIYGRELIVSDLTSMIGLDASYWGIRSLEGLQAATNLQYLYLGSNGLTDITPLAGMTSLVEVDLSYNRLNTNDGSAAMAVINGLIDQGTSVYYQPQDTSTDGMGLSNANVDNHSPAGTFVGTLSFEGWDVTWSLPADTNDNADFVLNGADLTLATPADYIVKSMYTVTVVATFPGGLEVSQDYQIAVNPLDEAPVVDPIAEQDIDEGQTLSVTVTATDVDSPAESLVYSLGADAPAGAAIDPVTGVFTWTPSEDQGPAVYSITVQVSDGIVSGAMAFQVNVAESNVVPTLDAIADKSASEGQRLAFTATASDIDVPAQTLTYSLIGTIPAGARVNATTGLFAWTPSETQGGQTYTLTMAVSDGVATDTRSFSVTVAEVNAAPVMRAIADMTVDEETTLSFTASANDPDIPVQTLTYSLGANAPAGASIDPATGVFSWTPTEVQGRGRYAITVRASDGALSDATTFYVNVLEVNKAPTLAGGTFSIPENQPAGTLVGIINAFDPETAVTYSLVPGPGSENNGLFILDGNRLLTKGGFDYEARGSYSVRVEAMDEGDLAVEAAFTITITDLPEFGKLQDKVHSITIQDSDGDLVTFSLTGGGSGAIQPDHSISLTGTTAGSVLSIRVKKGKDADGKEGDGCFNLGGISADGLIKSISAGSAFVNGPVALNTGNARVKTATVAMTLGGINDGSINTHGIPVTALKLQNWADSDATRDQFVAPWVGTISVSGRKDNPKTAANEFLAGDWEADILTISANEGVALNAMKVSGSLRGANISALGSINTIAAKGTFANARILASGSLKTVTAAALENSDILVGVSQNFPGHFASVFSNATARLSKLTVTGQTLPKGMEHPAYVTNSHISAPTYGVVSLANVPANSGTVLRVAADTGTLKVVSLSNGMLPGGTWNEGHPSAPGQSRPDIVEVLD